jgi:prevent-host-death family protein
MGMQAVEYDAAMSAAINEHRMQIAKARNILGEVIARARFGGDATILINRKKPAAVIVSPEFYDRACELMGLERVPIGDDAET